MADKIQFFNTAGKLTDQWDDNTSTYTTYEPTTGLQITSRAYTADETAAAQVRAKLATANANLANVQSKANTALTNNQTYLGIASPTNAQNAAQVQALTKQMDAVIRILMQLLDTTAGT